LGFGSSPTICGAPRRRAKLFSDQVLGRHPALHERALDHHQQVIGVDRRPESRARLPASP
jgi:hypothetical protein